MHPMTAGNLKTRLKKARTKHPETSFFALMSEVAELTEALENYAMSDVAENFEQQLRSHIINEAYDVAIVAIRIAEGELF